MAEKAGLSSINLDSGQLALRFPDGVLPEDLPPLDVRARQGKTAIWLPYQNNPDWQELLLKVLETIRQSKQTVPVA